MEIRNWRYGRSRSACSLRCAESCGGPPWAGRSPCPPWAAATSCRCRPARLVRVRLHVRARACVRACVCVRARVRVRVRVRACVRGRACACACACACVRACPFPCPSVCLRAFVLVPVCVRARARACWPKASRRVTPRRPVRDVRYGTREAIELLAVCLVSNLIVPRWYRRVTRCRLHSPAHRRAWGGLDRRAAGGRRRVGGFRIERKLWPDNRGGGVGWGGGA